jgi:dienelactone hydrolase
MEKPMHFPTHRQIRRQQLWNLLGDLPERKTPTATLLHTERRDGYTLEHLELDLNGIQKVPAILLLPDRLQKPAPAMLYLHWHGGNYDKSKEELLDGRPVLPAYAPVYAQKGIIALAIDSWCFGERRPYPDPQDGSRGEADTFKEMLWKGQCLFGMMLFDEWQALNYLCSRSEVDPHRIGAFGISMGATKAWWLAALDERIRCCIDLCCLTDFEALIAAKGLSGHGIYYYVPSLLKHFQTHEINELIVPRPRLSLNGARDALTPPEGVKRIRDHLYHLYARYGKAEDCRIELFDCGHEELPEMRKLVLEWLDRCLVAS